MDSAKQKHFILFSKERSNNKMTGESKQGEYKSDINDLLDVVQEFCMSDAFEQEFEMFAKEHAGAFRRSLEFSVHSAEHPMEFHNVYRQYLSKFEGMIEDFIVKVR